MRARQINDAGLDELASRFADQGFASRRILTAPTPSGIAFLKPGSRTARNAR